ncbi:Holliday junction DNA helicase RuvA [Candidatus Giovannonibacteria bacterium RIFCSPHIGHO2_02_FULL_44_11]|nr:MAG: Holliday junction DNA helicase RuvA [Candidatus Giovannonibacteria bacterium RIFCSPHIGHO2_02_FULL_44_11]
MIGHLSGKIIFKGEKHLILDVGGVGYKIFVAPATLKNLESPSFAKASEGTTELWTHLHVKEDALELYGFLHQGELEFFELLISISGIGPRSALGVFALAPVDTIKRAIAAGDVSYLTKVSGIGKKTAQKIVLELKDKLSGGVSVVSETLKDDADILEALVSLGYTQKDAREMLSKIPHGVAGRDKRLEAALKLTKR